MDDESEINETSKQEIMECPKVLSHGEFAKLEITQITIHRVLYVFYYRSVRLLSEPLSPL